MVVLVKNAFLMVAITIIFITVRAIHFMVVLKCFLNLFTKLAA